MNDFRAALDGFCESMREEGRRSAPPELKAMLERGRETRRTRLQRAIAAAAVMLALVAIPAYQREQRARDAAQAKADALLMEQVNAGLERPVPRAMSPLLAPVLLPVSSEKVCRTETRPC